MLIDDTMTKTCHFLLLFVLVVICLNEEVSGNSGSFPCTDFPEICFAENCHCRFGTNVTSISDDDGSCSPSCSGFSVCNNGDCVCRTFYAGPACNETDSCSTGNAGNPGDPCDPDNGTCVGIPGSYRCACNAGYISSPGKAECNDINECTIEGFSPPACDPISTNCTNTEGSYYCTCKEGFVMGTDNSTCADIDECSGTGGSSLCPPGITCINIPGSYTCDCGEGFGFNAEAFACEDIDECTLTGDSYPCNPGPDATNCTNTNGSFICTCASGYLMSADNSTCEDIDECELTGDQFPCDPTPFTGSCVNTNGSYQCGCDDAGRYQLNASGVYCVDVNECELTVEEGYPCDPINGLCENQDGSFSCTCPPGTTETFVTGNSWPVCPDINECNRTGDSYPCDPRLDVGLCININQSYYCDCIVGYGLTADNITCEELTIPDLTLQLDTESNVLFAGTSYTATCNAIGGSPPQTISWFQEGVEITTGIVSSESNNAGNAALLDTVSVLTFTPTTDDHRNYLSCRTSSGATRELMLRVLPSCPAN